VDRPQHERPAHPLWLRTAVDLPDDPWLHGAVGAFWSDFGMNWAARSTHHLLSPEPVTSVSATHSLWFHRPIRSGDWHLLEVNTESIFGNQAFVQAALFDPSGQLAMTIAQGVFVRRGPPHSG
jgi:acyl-CoA thioesterase-2